MWRTMMVSRNMMMRTLMVKVMVMVMVVRKTLMMKRNLMGRPTLPTPLWCDGVMVMVMVRKNLIVKTNLAHSPLVWTLSRLFSWVQDTGIPSLSDKIFHIDMFHCVPQQHKGSYLHILTVGATSLAQVTFGLPKIAIKSENLFDHISVLQKNLFLWLRTIFLFCLPVASSLAWHSH